MCVVTRPSVQDNMVVVRLSKAMDESQFTPAWTSQARRLCRATFDVTAPSTPLASTFLQKVKDDKAQI